MSRPPTDRAHRPGWYPSGDDELLLRAALQRDQRGEQAWAALRPRLDIDTMEHQQASLLPLVHRSLSAIGSDEPELPRLKGLHRHTWYRNQTLLQRVAPLLAQLRTAGIPTMALKGVPLGLGYYDDIGLRPMADLDLLVPFTGFREAVAIADGLGLTGDPITEAAMRYFHSRPCEGADGSQVDLHWMVHEALGLPGVPAAWWGNFWDAPIAPDEFWSRAVPIDVAGIPTTAPCATDMLLHVLVHGVGFGSGARVRWVADAVTILDSTRDTGRAVQWDSLVDQAARRRVTLALRDTLGYLDEAGFADVPATTLAAIRTHLPGRREQMVYDIRVDPTIRSGRLQSAKWATARFVCATAQESLPRAIAALPAFLAWDADRPRDVPVRLLRRVASGAGRAVSAARSARPLAS